MGVESILLLVVVFYLGVAVGGVLVALQRASRMSRIKEQFREELEEVERREARFRQDNDCDESSRSPESDPPDTLNPRDRRWRRIA